METRRRRRGDRKRSSFGCSASARYSAGDWQRMLGPEPEQEVEPLVARRTHPPGGRSRRLETTGRRPCSTSSAAKSSPPCTRRRHHVRRRASARPGRASRRPIRACARRPCRDPPTPVVDTTNARSRDAVSCVGTSTGTSFEFRLTPSSKRWTSGLKPMRSIVVLERALGDDENGVGRRHEALELRCRRRRQARDDDRADLPDAEYGLEPVHGGARHHDHAVAGADASLAECERPDSGALRDLAELTVLDDPVASEEGQRAPLRIARERLHDVAGEVEAIGDLPAAVDERGAEGKLERRAGRARFHARGACRCEDLSRPSHYRPEWARAECESCDCAETSRSSRDRARRRTARAAKGAQGAGSHPPPRAPRCVWGSEGAC